jgi:hypothetical protein
MTKQKNRANLFRGFQSAAGYLCVLATLALALFLLIGGETSFAIYGWACLLGFFLIYFPLMEGIARIIELLEEIRDN